MGVGLCELCFVRSTVLNMALANLIFNINAFIVRFVFTDVHWKVVRVSKRR